MALLPTRVYFPIPRVVGDVDDTILDKGLGPIGDFPLPRDLRDSAVPEFYRDGLRDFQRGGKLGGWGQGGE